MGQKTHPKMFRLGVIESWDSNLNGWNVWNDWNSVSIELWNTLS